MSLHSISVDITDSSDRSEHTKETKQRTQAAVATIFEQEDTLCKSLNGRTSSTQKGCIFSATVHREQNISSLVRIPITT